VLRHIKKARCGLRAAGAASLRRLNLLTLAADICRMAKKPPEQPKPRLYRPYRCHAMAQRPTPTITTKVAAASSVNSQSIFGTIALPRLGSIFKATMHAMVYSSSSPRAIPWVPSTRRFCMTGSSLTHFGDPPMSSVRSAAVPHTPWRTAIRGSLDDAP